MKMNNINTNVGLWLAMDEENKFISIDKAVNGVDYICPECGTTVRARALNSDCVSPHYYHLNTNECSCESAIHKYWKENLIKIGDTINLKGIGSVKCIDLRIEFVFNTPDGIYKPDIVIKTDNKEHRYIIFEICNTNYKDTTYINKWRYLKYDVYEVYVSKLNYKKYDLNSCCKLLYSKYYDGNILKLTNKINDIYKSNKLNPEYEKIYDIERTLTKEQKELVDLGFFTIQDFMPKSGYILSANKDYITLDRFRQFILKDVNSLEYNMEIDPLNTGYIDDIIEKIFKYKWDKKFYVETVKPIYKILKDYRYKLVNVQQ